jgi:hypothetical protein
MAIVPKRHDARSSLHAVAAPGSVLLCALAALAPLTAAYAWSSLCSDGTFERCLNGTPSFELVFQAVLASAGFCASLVVRLLVKRHSYGLAGTTLAVAIVLFAGWAVFLDAATHGWDDLKLLWLG